MVPIGQLCHTPLGLGAQEGRRPSLSAILPGGIYTCNGPVSVVAVLRYDHGDSARKSLRTPSASIGTSLGVSRLNMCEECVKTLFFA